MSRRRRLLGAPNGDFLKLWSGETVSWLGTQVTTLALPLVAVITLHASAGAIGILNACRYAPFIIVTLFAGVVIDRVRRRETMMMVNLGRALVIGAIPFAAMSDSLGLGLLDALAFAAGIFTVFFDLSYQAYLPSIVSRDQLAPSNARLQASASVAELGGPGLGGLLVQIFGAPYALVFDSLSYVVSFASLALIRHRESRREPGARPVMVRSIREGFRFTFSNPYLRAIAGEAATFNLLEQAILTAFVVYAIRDLHFSAGILGAIISAGAAGALCGSIATGALNRRWGLGRTTVGSMVIGCTFPVLIALPSGGGVTTMLFLAAVFFLYGAGIAVSNVLVVSLRQTVTPDRMMGRMNASYRFFTYGAIPLGALLGGGLAEVVGLRPTLLICGCGLVLAPLWIFLSPVVGLGSLLELKYVEEEQATAPTEASVRAT